jgi:hypothetical protein
MSSATNTFKFIISASLFRTRSVSCFIFLVRFAEFNSRQRQILSQFTFHAYRYPVVRNFLQRCIGQTCATIQTRVFRKQPAPKSSNMFQLIFMNTYTSIGYCKFRVTSSASCLNGAAPIVICLLQLSFTALLTRFNLSAIGR